MPKIVYITSGKVGIHRFTYNELVELENNGVEFFLCFTQFNPGPWMPLDHWSVVVASKKQAFLGFLQLLITQPILLLSLLLEGRINKVLPYLFIALSLYRSLMQNSVSSIHCQMGDKKLYIGYFLKKLLDIPLSVTVHAHELYQRNVYDSNDRIQKLFTCCDVVFTISNFNAEIIASQFGISQEKLKVMRLFPDNDCQNKVKNKTSILIVANWADKKGYKVLFQAIKDINKENFVVWVVGGSYLSDNSIDLNELIKGYGIQDKVALLGRQGGQVLDIIYSACDIFCLPSHTEYYEDGNPAEREGIPVALMEAMAWGKPVISTKHAGIPELVENILVEEKNADQLKQAIEYLLEHPEVWAQLGERNKQIIKKHYTKENVKILSGTLKECQKSTT